MKIKILATTAAILLLSGCSQQQESGKTTKPPAEDKGAVEKSADMPSKAPIAINNSSQKTPANQPQQETNQVKPTKDMQYLNQYDGATIHTSQGDITVKLYNADTPLTVENFLKLINDKFYDGVRFHRVIKGFMIQTGDPNSKDADWSNDGAGGPGYTIPAEIKHKNARGTLATARLGDQMNPKKDSSGSQFYINTVDNGFLDGQYTVFGEVTSGMDVVDTIEGVKVNSNDHPLEDITIKSIDLIKKK